MLSLREAITAALEADIWSSMHVSLAAVASGLSPLSTASPVRSLLAASPKDHKDKEYDEDDEQKDLMDQALSCEHAGNPVAS